MSDNKLVSPKGEVIATASDQTITLSKKYVAELRQKLSTILDFLEPTPLSGTLDACESAEIECPWCGAETIFHIKQVRRPIAETTDNRMVEHTFKTYIYSDNVQVHGIIDCLTCGKYGIQLHGNPESDKTIKAIVEAWAK